MDEREVAFNGKRDPMILLKGLWYNKVVRTQGKPYGIAIF